MSNSSASSHKETARVLAMALAHAAAEFKGEQVRILDVADLIYITDYFVIVTTQTPRQTRGMADALNEAAKASGAPSKGVIEGSHRSPWLLLDYGNVVVHVLTADAREFFDLDNLWIDADEVEIQAA
ncbi:MAG: ribosome silencing factor [Planctomycetota bacterium]|nr:MAG: ribosome silencing factor [Planctomycetota bacterium]